MVKRERKEKNRERRRQDIDGKGQNERTEKVGLTSGRCVLWKQLLMATPETRYLSMTCDEFSNFTIMNSIYPPPQIFIKLDMILKRMHSSSLGDTGVQSSLGRPSECSDD